MRDQVGMERAVADRTLECRSHVIASDVTQSLPQEVVAKRAARRMRPNAHQPRLEVMERDGGR